jgi:hypothetical protein
LIRFFSNSKDNAGAGSRIRPDDFSSAGAWKKRKNAALSGHNRPVASSEPAEFLHLGVLGSSQARMRQVEGPVQYDEADFRIGERLVPSRTLHRASGKSGVSSILRTR